MITPIIQFAPALPVQATQTIQTPFSRPRDPVGHKFVYLVITARAGGLSVGVNMNPDKECNFDCAYCDVHRDCPSSTGPLDVEAMSEELQDLLNFARSCELHAHPFYGHLPADLKEVRQIALSGDGEPTLCPVFLDAVQTVVHVRALNPRPFLKIVLITNGSNLDSEQVREGLRYFTAHDEIWVKFDACAEERYRAFSRTDLPQEKVLANIALTGKTRPVVIQTMLAKLDGIEPSPLDIDTYIENLNELTRQGTKIRLVQLYSLSRAPARPGCQHLSLRELSPLAQWIRTSTGLRVEIF